MNKQEKEQNYMIGKTVLQETINYLGTRPASEVFNLLNSLMKLPEINLVTPEAPKASEGVEDEQQ